MDRLKLLPLSCLEFQNQLTREPWPSVAEIHPDIEKYQGREHSRCLHNNSVYSNIFGKL